MRRPLDHDHLSMLSGNQRVIRGRSLRLVPAWSGHVRYAPEQVRPCLDSEQVRPCLELGAGQTMSGTWEQVRPCLELGAGQTMSGTWSRSDHVWNLSRSDHVWNSEQVRPCLELGAGQTMSGTRSRSDHVWNLGTGQTMSGTMSGTCSNTAEGGRDPPRTQSERCQGLPGKPETYSQLPVDNLSRLR